jgi:hypothetical protein
VFISDSYLDEAFVRERLVACGYETNDGAVYVSSRWRERKFSGALFRRVLECEGIGAAQLTHVGDNSWSDETCPRKLGVHATLYDASAPIAAETRALRGASRLSRLARDPLGHLVAGGIRRVRLVDPRFGESVAFRTGATLAGPIYLPFVCWALRKARGAGAPRVFFLARDGQILLELARTLGQRLDLGLEVRYLFVSRQSLNLATLDIPGAARDWLFASDFGLTAARLARRLHLEPNEVLECLRELGVKLQTIDSVISSGDADRIARDFERSSLRQRATPQSLDARTAALGYLRQENVITGPETTIVDLGWLGSLQDRLAELSRAHAGSTQFQGYYFGFSSSKVQPRPEKHGFLCGRAVPTMNRFIVNQAKVLFETLAHGDHGSTLAYERRDGSWHPVLRPADSDPNVIRQVHDGAIAFANHLPDDALQRLWAADQKTLRTISGRVGFRAKFAPSAEEASFLGNFGVSEQGGVTEGRVAPPLRGWPALIALLSRDPLFPAERSFWVEASLRRADSHLAGGWGVVIRQLSLLAFRAITWLPRFISARLSSPLRRP